MIQSARRGKAEEGVGTSRGRREHREGHLTEPGWEGKTGTATRRKCLNPIPKEEWDSARQKRLGRPSQRRKQLTKG